MEIRFDQGMQMRMKTGEQCMPSLRVRPECELPGCPPQLVRAESGYALLHYNSPYCTIYFHKGNKFLMLLVS